MAIERYDHYGQPRLSSTEGGNAYLIRDVLTEDGRFSGICEYATYDYGGDISWHICKEGVEFADIRPFIAALKTAGKQ